MSLTDNNSEGNDNPEKTELIEKIKHLYSELRRVKSDAAEKERLLLTIINNLPVGLVVADKNGKIFLENDEFAAIWEDRRYVEFSEYDQYQAWWYYNGNKIENHDWPLYRAIVSGEKSYNEIILIQTFGGKKKIMRNSAIPLHDEQNNIIGGIAVIEDITEKTNLEERLIRNEERFRTLIQNSFDAVLLLNAQGTVTYTTPSIKNVLGFEPEDQIGTNVFEWIHPDFHAAVKSIFEDLLTTPNGRASAIAMVKHKGDGWIWVEAVGVNLLHEPAVSAVVVNYRDITKRTIAEQKREESEAKLRRAKENLRILNKQKDKLFSLIAHDLRSPFVSLLSLTQLLVDDYENLTDLEIRQFISNIHESSKRVFALIENLMQWSRFQTGSMKFKPENFNLNQLLAKAVNLYKGAAESKDILINCEVLEQLHIEADRYMIDTVIRNLISNAVKFTPNGGTVTVSAAKKEGRVEVSVKDTGVGIQPERLEKLFTVDENMSTLGTASESGTGLGLIICKEFIERHNSTLKVHTTPRGTIFSFEI